MPITMYDDVNLDLIPANAAAVGGYVNGRWPTFPAVVKRWPKAKHVSFAVTAEADADCLDIERGDATPAQAPAWVRRQKAARPAVYCSVSDAATVLGVLKAAGIPRSKVRLITAHYTGRPHICSPACGFGMPTAADGTQWTDKALGRSLDESLLLDSFFATPPAPVSPAVRRRALGVWARAQRAHGATWAWLKRQPKWLLWRKLGGK